MRLIDADALKRGYQDICAGIACEECSLYFGGCKIEKMIDDAPTIDPVKHGKWIWDDEGYHCSECFYHAYGNTGEVYMGDWHYCPNCGAKMDGGEG